jgi:CDP-paratose 2-epimerase
MKKILVTGSSGLIGSEVCAYFNNLNFEIIGIDNNQREKFFGQKGSTRWKQSQLQRNLENFTHCELDIRDRVKLLDKIKEIKPYALIHAAAQPSHDKAAEIPFEDFDINAVGTLNLLEAVRRFSPETIFIHMSTNKVYGDAPNEIKLKELDTRWDFDDDNFKNGISESFRIDQSKHSLFGASKLSSDILVQEYGRYFKIPTACLRGGCLTGPNHSGVELHGFLSLNKNPTQYLGTKVNKCAIIYTHLMLLDLCIFLLRILNTVKYTI